jgi:tetratricopeptide (TPR) repeat protein
MTRSGEALPESLLTWFAHPDRVAAGSAAIARGLRAGRGAAQAADFLQQQDRLDLGEPRHAEALAELVEALVAAERAGEGVAVVGTALERHPDVAVFHALRGRALASGGGSKQAARAAYDRALALDAEEPRALAGLAQLEADRGDAAAALALYDRALAVDPDDRASARAAASQLRALGRSEEAETRLEALLRDRPDDAAAALSLAELRVARDADPERTRRLAQRAVSFRGGAEAEALLASLGGEARPAGAAPTP